MSTYGYGKDLTTEWKLPGDSPLTSDLASMTKAHNGRVSFAAFAAPLHVPRLDGAA